MLFYLNGLVVLILKLHRPQHFLSPALIRIVTPFSGFEYMLKNMEYQSRYLSYLKLQPLLSLGVGCLVGARRKGGQQVACLTGIPATHPCWYLTKDVKEEEAALCNICH